MSRKKILAIGWAVIILSVIGSFMIIARSAIFGDASFSDVDYSAWFITTLPSIFVFFLITTKGKKDNDKKK